MAVALAMTPTGVSAQDLPCAVWVVRNALASPAAWRQALDAVERAGCRRMYLQVSGRWDALYPSHVFVPPVSPPRGWEDPLADALVEAHARGIEVHAWVNALLGWSAADPPPDPNHVWRRHPDWFVSRDGRSMRELTRLDLDRAGLAGEGWFLDPAREEVRTELRRFVLELVTRYSVDGVHLDYIRYPSGWTPLDGASHVTRLVALIRNDLVNVRSEAVLSAAVMPVPDVARDAFGQDWAEWLDLGLVDAVAPMVYRDSPGSIEGVVRGWPESVPREQVWVGVRIDRISPAELAEAARRLADQAVAGLALFSHNLLLDDPVWSRPGGR
ncbi:MAG: glycoside hydrolase family 10 protein [Gemmatimonadota bacterium]